MYDGLVKSLRVCGRMTSINDNCISYVNGCCEAFPDCAYALMDQAADAIEELSGLCASQSKDCSEAVAKYLELWAKQLRWIPVTDRLPELHEEVLVCNGEYGLSDLGFATVAVWDGTDWIEAWDRRTAIHCVTHWMPRPYPPKEE